MHFKLIFISLTSIALAACSGNQTTEQASVETSGIEETLKKADLLASVPFRKLPLTDSTNFDNFEEQDALSNELITKLHLKEIEPNFEQFYSRYRLAFSDGIDAVVITMAIENEMKTYLITYRKEDYQLIDKVLISYDEIAESAFSAQGKVSAKEITVTHVNYMSEEPIIELKKYQIGKSGKFKQVK